MRSKQFSLQGSTIIILRCCTGFLSGLFASRPDGQSGRRGFVIGVMIGAMLMVGAPGWLPQGGVIPAAQAKPPKPPVPNVLKPVPDEIFTYEQGNDVLGNPLDFPEVFSFDRTPISVGMYEGWWLLATGNRGPFTLPMPDLDQDGVAETGQAWDRIDHHELQIWLSSVGPRGTREPDILIAERFTNQTHVFGRIGAAEDVDGDGVREITTLGSATNASNGQAVQLCDCTCDSNSHLCRCITSWDWILVCIRMFFWPSSVCFVCCESST
ncbi:MAG: hypothetical protein ACK54T_05265 [bacterium]|jgi:hypothetical protein